MKKIYYFFILILLALIPLNKALAGTYSWEFTDPNNYTHQDTNLSIVSGGLGQLKMQLNHESNIVDGAGGATLAGADSLVIDGNYAYISSSTSDALEIVDISNPTNPIHVGNILDGAGGATLNNPKGLIKNGNYVYIAVNTSDTLEVVDVTDPTTPTHVTSISDTGTTYLNAARGVAMSGSYLYVTSTNDDAITIFDISTPSNPTKVGSLRDTTRLNGAFEVAVSGNYIYVTSYNNDSVEVIDVTDPTNPTFVGELTDGTGGAILNGPVGITIDGNYAYIGVYLSDALEIIDITNPTSIFHAGNIENGGTALLDGAAGVEIEGNYAYISSYVSNAIEIIDVSNKTIPIHVTNISDGTGGATLAAARNTIKIGNYLYTTAVSSNALEIVKITYSGASPYIIPNTFLTYSGSVDKLSTTFSLKNQGSVKYQISKDNGTTWYYLSGTTRTTTTAGVLESNTESEINAEIQSFNGLAGGTGEFIWKVFLISDTSQKVEIDKIDMAFTTAGLNEIIDFENPGGYTVTNGTWTRETTEFYEGTYAIEADNGGNDNSVSCFNVNRDIYNDSTISFYRKISSESGYDFLRFYIDGTKIEEWSGDVARGSGSYNIGNGNHDFDWCYEKDGSVSNGSDTAWIDYIEIKELPAPPVEVVVLDFEIEGGYTVTTSVTAEDWFRQQNIVYEGDYAIQSADINDNDSVCFERNQEVTDIDTGISFYRKVDSESGYDFLRFYIDGTEQDKWAGDIDWTKQVYSLSPATYTLKWCYTKDGSVSNGADAAYIDLVTVTQDPPIITEVIPVATPTNDNTPDYTFNTPIEGEISYSGSCTSSTNTGAVIGDNTITFDTLADGIYTDCTIQILASPQNSTILNVSNFTVDTTGIDITFNNPVDGGTITPADFNIDISYSDDNGVDTGSIDIQLFERDGNSYGPNIAPDFIDFTGATITETGAIYPTLALTGATQYKIEFSIDDTTGNNSVGTSVFDVSSGDTTPPSITNNFPINGQLFPNSLFNIDISYSDIDSTINTGSILTTLKKWDGTAWGTDIFPTYLLSSNVSTTNTIYNMDKLGFGKYQLYFYIEDSIGNGGSTTIDFYVDEVELIVSSGALEIGDLKAGIQQFSTGTLDITVKTVGAGFDLILNKDSNLTTGTIDILDWNGTTGVGYDQDPYSSTISIINTNEIIATQTGSINTDGNKNIYIYSIKLGALIGEEQAAGEYSMPIRFGLNLNY